MNQYPKRFVQKAILQFAKTSCAALITALVTATTQLALAAPGLDSPSAVGPYLDGAFPATSPGSAEGEWVQIDYYPGLSFVEPIRVIEHPAEDRLLIVGKDGLGWTVSHQQGATDKTLFMDISPIMHGKSGVGEGGISDLAFHPEFGLPQSSNSNYVYISYRWSPTQSGTFSNSPTLDGYNRISRFSVINGQVALNTEQVLINQYDREQWHIGGDMFFGDDGFLYISTGDEGNCCNRQFNTQRLDGGLFSGILRIDVDQDSSRSHPIRRQPTHLQENPSVNGAQWPQSFTQNYFIPNDNPFVDPSGNSLEEFYSIGLRHPWTISRDPATGNIWVADVGQTAMEEINISNLGDNHQWGYAEGTGAGLIPKPANVIGNEAPPIWAYPRSQGQAVIGAGVYRGSKFPELIGKYLFSDFISGNLWTATPGGDVAQIGTVTAGFPNGVNSYLLDSKGDILMARTAGGLASNGKIEMLVRAGNAVQTPEPPNALSQTGAFTNLANLTLNNGCIPYDLNVPFWSDAALKSRWMCIPNNGNHNTNAEKIGFSEEGDWSFPEGTVLIKHFELQTNTSNPSSAIRLETRFVVHSEDGWYGVTYRWNNAGTDAFLLTQGEDQTYTINTPSGSFQQTWRYPSRSECLTCHTDAAGGALGPVTRQLNSDTFYPLTGRTENQLETLNALGIFNPAIPQNQLNSFLGSVLTSSPTEDETLSLAARARSYLDSNCSYCHMPTGVRANFDARLTTPLASQNLVNGELVESLGINNESVITPGSLSSSILFHRMASAGESFSMPPIAKFLVDDAGVDVLSEWILALDSFEVGNDTTSGGAFIDGHHPSLYINEQDTFVQDNEPGVLLVKEFKFYAQRLGNPLTPVVVRVNSNNNFTVLAIGDTRTQNEYSVGSNVFPFSDDGNVELTLAAADRIAVGFMDSFPDGSGWGAGTVIPATAGGGANQDEIWALLPDPLITQGSGFVANRDTASVQVNQTILATNNGKQVQQFTNLRRSYKFAVTFGHDIGNSGTTGGSSGVTFYENGNFAGASWTVGVGSYPNIIATPVGSDNISSIDIPAGFSVLACENTNFGGVCNTYTSSVSGLGPLNFNDEISSVEVSFAGDQPPPPPPPPPTENVALNQPATQSSTGFSGVAARAVDGNTNGSYSVGSVTHTQLNSQNPWWRVDLGETYDVDQINVFNRINCCNERLNGTTVYVGDVNSSDPADYTAVGTLTGSTAVQTLAELNTTGRYVMVRIAGQGTLSLAEVQVFGEQQTTGGGTPDGDSGVTFYENGNFAGSSWTVGVGSYPNLIATPVGNDSISSIDIPAGFSVLACENTNFGGVCNTYTSSVSGLGPLNFNDEISSVEVTFTGDQPPPPPPPPPTENVALNQPVSQSSTSSGGVATRAVDGNTNGTYNTGSVTHTQANSQNPWWRVDLGDTYNVEQISVFNRTDNCCNERLNGATVYVGSIDSTDPADYTVVGTLTGSTAVQALAAGNTTGRYVMVRIAGQGTLSLAEVQVFGELQTTGGGTPEDDTGVTFYENGNFSGASWSVGAGTYPNISATPVGSDSISSIDISAGFSVLACEDANFGGVCNTYTSSVSGLGSLNFNDLISSVEVFLTDDQSPPPTDDEAFIPDPNKLYHIDNPAHGLRLAAIANSEILESRPLTSTGVNTQWQFVQSPTSGLWHIQRAAGGNTPRIRTVLTTTPDMQSTGSSGDWTRFSITPNANRPGTYLLTVPLAKTENQRLRLLSSGATDFSTNNNTGNNPSFVFVEVN